MHDISPQTAQLAQKYALQLVEEGKSVEEIGKRLQSNNQMSPEIGQHIEASEKFFKQKKCVSRWSEYIL